MPRLLSIVFMLLIFTFATGFGDINRGDIDVSMINLIATPEKYHGKIVRIIGVAFIEQRRSSAIFLTADCYKNYVAKNSLWVDTNFQSFEITDDELWLVSRTCEDIQVPATCQVHDIAQFADILAS